MRKENMFFAVYIDMENVQGMKFSLEKMMEAFIASESGENNIIFAIKSAYGGTVHIKDQALLKQITDHNFRQIDTPHIAQKKNRADLFISTDALETVIINNPKIDRYFFISSDSDFTVIGDKLRKYGKQAWLVCKKKDKERIIFSKSFDKLLFIEDFVDDGSPKASKENDKIAVELFRKALTHIDKDRLPSNVSAISDMMKRFDESYDISSTSFGRFMDLVQYCVDQKMLTTTKRDDTLLIADVLV